MALPREEIKIDRDIDRALSIVFLCLAGVSFYSFVVQHDPMIKIEVLSSIPLNLLAALSFWTRDIPKESASREELVIPAISFLLPFAVTNNVVFLPISYGSVYGLMICIPGIALSIYSFLRLRRSFAILPAVRGIVDTGPYRHVRHPLYLGEFIYLVGMMILAFNVFSLVLLFLSLLFLVMRMDIEERKLAKYPEYAQYMKAVKYRLIPGIY
jgi:protein-S-isoprenylcysteine O-methyltransferase Ste14